MLYIISTRGQIRKTSDERVLAIRGDLGRGFERIDVHVGRTQELHAVHATTAFLDDYDPNARYRTYLSSI